MDLILLTILGATIFIPSLVLLILTMRYRNEIHTIHKDITDFRQELILLASQRKRRF